MTATNDLEGLYSVLEKSAELLDVAPARDKVWPILTAYQDVLPEAVIAFRVATRNAGDLDCRFSVPKDVDPYARALSNGLITRTDHPVGALLSDVQDRLTVHHHGVDFGVVDGFSKTWTFFPLDKLQELSGLAEIPSMPPSLAENIDFYTRHGLASRVSMIGVDYPSRTVNVYFLGAPAECRDPAAVRAMLREFGLADPSEQMLKLAGRATGFYTTLTYDSAKVQRITFAVIVPDLRALPDQVEVDANVEKFARNAPYTYDADPKGIFGVTSYAGGEYYKLQTYYRITDGSVEAKGLLGSAPAAAPSSPGSS